MYREWPFFRMVLDNAELSLAQLYEHWEEAAELN